MSQTERAGRARRDDHSQDEAEDPTVADDEAES